MVTAWLLVTTACQQQHQPVMVEYKSTFPVDTFISPPEIPMQENLRTTQLLRWGNRLLAFGDYDVVRLYTYPNYTFIRSLQAPAHYARNVIEDELYLEAKGYVDKYQLDARDSLVLKDSFKITSVPFCIGVHRLDEERYLFSDYYDWDGTSEFHIVNIKTREWQSGGEYPEPPSRFRRLRDFKLAYAHNLSTKPDGSAFVVSYGYVRRVHIYNAEGQLLHAIKLDYTPGNNNLADPDRKNDYWHNNGVVTTDNYIYLLNPEQQPPSPPKLHSEIIIMDWDGNLKVRYRLDRFVYSIIADEERGVIVGCGDKGKGAAFFELNILTDL